MSRAESFKVKILFFGATADATERRSTLLDLPAGATSADALKRLLEIYPSLASHKLLYSVNQTYASGSERLNDDDELAIFTAVSGG